MNFDPRTKAREEEEDNEADLEAYARALASMSRIERMAKSDPIPNEALARSCRVAFAEIWLEAMKYTDHLDLHRRVNSKIN